jgi:hypothetical protein
MSYEYRSIELDITSLGMSPITYVQVLALLQAFSTKMSRKGYTTWLVEVFSTEGNVRIADALIYDDENWPPKSQELTSG